MPSPAASVPEALAPRAGARRLPGPADAPPAPPSAAFRARRRATFAALVAGYMGYYLCRQNLGAAQGLLARDAGVDALAFGTIASAGTLVYAAGKLVTGPIADSRGGRAVFLAGLAGSVAASLVFGLGGGVAFLGVAWAVNRLFQSMGWGGIVSVAARWYPRSAYGTAMGGLTVSYQLGGAVASAFAGALLAAGLGWRGLFLVPALALAATGLAIRPFLASSPADAGFPPLPLEPLEPPPSGSPRRGFRALLSSPVFLAMCGLSFALTLIRECFMLWLPAYFGALGAGASAAAFKSAIFPLVGCAGTLLAGWVSDRYLDGRRPGLLALFLAGLACALFGLAAVRPGTLSADLAPVLVGAAGFLLLAPYSMIGGGAIALDHGGRDTAGTAAGLLDATGYLGAALAGRGVAEVVTSRGWPAAFAAMAVLALASAIVCAAVAARRGSR